MSSRHKENNERQIEITRETDGWSIRIKDSNPETRHKPLSPEEKQFVRDGVKRAASVVVEEERSQA